MEIKIEKSNEKDKNSDASNKILKRAIDAYSKGEKLVFKRKFKSAETHFKKSFNYFMQLNDKIRGEKVLLKLTECYLIENQYHNASSTMRDAANLRLLDNKFINAIEHYQSVIELLLKLDEKAVYIPKILEIISFISMCYLAVGNFDMAAESLKKNLSKYGKGFKNKSKIKILHYVTNINNLILTKKIDDLKELKKEMLKLNLRDGERRLFNRIFEILNVFTDSTISLRIVEKEIRAGDQFTIFGTLNSKNDVEIKSISLNLEHGLKIISGPQISENKISFTAKLISKISGNSKIDINLICITEDFEFPLSSKKVIKIKEGYPIIQFYPSTDQLIGKIEQPLSLNFVVKNVGMGEAVDLSLIIEHSVGIQLIEGTKEKKLHSLAPQEEFVFVYNLTGKILGKHIIKAKLSYQGINSSDKFPDIIKEIDIAIVS
ncbi:MAG: hypothetical protein ACTSWR_05515 [Candidatus Helarchaeota archaeon]